MGQWVFNPKVIVDLEYILILHLTKLKTRDPDSNLTEDITQIREQRMNRTSKWNMKIEQQN